MTWRSNSKRWSPLVPADPGLLERVVANLVDHARRFSPVGVPIHIKAEYRDATVRLSVADSGPGVPAADWERIFTPFQRLDDHRSDGGVGSVNETIRPRPPRPDQSAIGAVVDQRRRPCSRRRIGLAGRASCVS